MITGIETVAAAALRATLAKALAATAIRLGTALNPINRRKRQNASSLELLLRTLTIPEHLNLLGHIDSLPKGRTLASVATVLNSLEMEAVLGELVATEICAAQTHRSEVNDNFCAVFRQAWVSSPIAEVDSMASAIFTQTAAVVTGAVERLRKIDTNAFDRLQAGASNTLVRATIEAAGRHRGSLTAFTAPARFSQLCEWEANYRRQLVAKHGHIVPPDFDRKRKIPLRELYVAPRISSNTIDTVDARETSLDQFMHQLDRTVLLGDPGGGKSTASDYIASEFARESSDRLPFVVVLREFADGGDIEKSIVQHIESTCTTLYQCEPPEGAVEYFLLGGKALVIFDGLDELIDTSRRREVTQRVELFSTRYPLCSALVTSRRVGYEQAQLDPTVFNTSELSGFTARDVSAYVNKWFSYVDELQGDELAEKTAFFLSECSTVPDLTATPLMLSLMCIIYRGQGYIPKNRPAVYEHCARLLFEKWDRSRRIFVELRAASQVDNAVKHIAYWMFTNLTGVEAVAELDLVRETSEFLKNTFDDEDERRSAAQEFVEFCRGRAWVFSEAGTTADGVALFKFTHRTFMEYFAAYELARRCDGPEALARVLLPHVASQEWDVMGQLAVQIGEKHFCLGAERIFRAMLGDKRRRSQAKRDNVIAFVWRCLGFVPGSPSLIRDLVFLSMESSYLNRDSRHGNAHEAPSIFYAFDVLPEQRVLVGDAVGKSLRERMASKDPEVVLHAQVLAASWGQGTNLLHNRDARSYWNDWTIKYIRENRSVVLGPSLGERDAWKIALIRGAVSMRDYLSAAANWHVSAMDELFASQTELPLHFGFLGWAYIAIRESCGHEPPSSGSPRSELRSELRASILSQLSELGEWIGDTLDGPVVTELRGVQFFGDLSGRWEVLRGDEDAIWATWVLLACVIENAAKTRAWSREESSRWYGPLIAALIIARSEGSTDVSSPFEGTVFDNLSKSRSAIRDRWLRGEINVLFGDESTEIA